MYTFICSAILGIIVSWCLFGKEFNKKLASVALTVLCITFGATLIVSGVSIKFLPTEKIFTEKSKIIPHGYNVKIRDTTVNYITSINKGKKVSKKELVVNRDTIPYYFKFDVEKGIVLFKTDYTSDGYEEEFNLSDLKVVKIDTTGWFGINRVFYNTDKNNWVTDISLPYKDSEYILHLNKTQFHELSCDINEYNKLNKTNIQILTQ